MMNDEPGWETRDVTPDDAHAIRKAFDERRKFEGRDILAIKAGTGKNKDYVLVFCNPGPNLRLRQKEN